jgi:biotin carboxylase
MQVDPRILAKQMNNSRHDQVRIMRRIRELNISTSVLASHTYSTLDTIAELVQKTHRHVVCRTPMQPRASEGAGEIPLLADNATAEDRLKEQLSKWGHSSCSLTVCIA